MDPSKEFVMGKEPTQLVYQPETFDPYTQKLTSMLLHDGHTGTGIQSLSNALLHEDQNKATEGNLPSAVKSLFQNLERDYGVVRSEPDQEGNITLSYNKKPLEKANKPTEPEAHEVMEQVILGSLDERLSTLATALHKETTQNPHPDRSHLVDAVRSFFDKLEDRWGIKRTIT